MVFLKKVKLVLWFLVINQAFWTHSRPLEDDNDLDEIILESGDILYKKKEIRQKDDDSFTFDIDTFTGLLSHHDLQSSADSYWNADVEIPDESQNLESQKYDLFDAEDYNQLQVIKGLIEKVQEENFKADNVYSKYEPMRGTSKNSEATPNDGFMQGIYSTMTRVSDTVKSSWDKLTPSLPPQTRGDDGFEMFEPFPLLTFLPTQSMSQAEVDIEEANQSIEPSPDNDTSQRYIDEEKHESDSRAKAVAEYVSLLRSERRQRSAGFIHDYAEDQSIVWPSPNGPTIVIDQPIDSDPLPASEYISYEGDGKNSLHNCLQSGRPIIKDYSYTADGNYKMEIIFKATEKLYFDKLTVGKCNILSSGLELFDKDRMKPILVVDLNKCQKMCDYDSCKTDKGFENPASELADLNQPVVITFDLLEPASIFGSDSPSRLEGRAVAASYKFMPSVNYSEDYIVGFDTSDKTVESLLVDFEGNVLSQSGNMQFTFQTFTDNEFEYHTDPPREIGDPGHSTHFEISPSNGFNVDIMTNLPESCYITDQSTGSVVRLWDMKSSEFEDTCFSELKYDEKFGTWKFSTDLYELFGYVDNNAGLVREGAEDAKFKINCAVRLCENRQSSECVEKIRTCGYSSKGGGALEMPLEPFIPSFVQL